jgi:hemerythrin superfamily protein
MDAFNLLKADHRKVEELFSELESARGQAKLPVFEQIKMELDLHAELEEKLFYPALEEPEQTHDLALEAYEEHAVVKNLLRQLSRGKTADDEWQAQVKVLQENVEHHVEEEENELFKKAKAALSKEEIDELGELMAAEKNRKQSRAAKGGAKKSASASKSASKTKSASTAQKRTRSAKKGGSKKAASGSKSGSKKSAKKK